MKLGHILILSNIFLFSCENEKYPKYSLSNIHFIPDSLKSEHRKFIIEVVRSASNEMTTEDYEDVDETIKQAESTADNIFSINVVGLTKQINPEQWDVLRLKPDEMSKREKQIFDSLLNVE